MSLSLPFDRGWVLHLGINSRLGRVRHPLPDEDLVLLREKIRPLPFPHVIHPMPFEVIPTPLRQHSVPTPLVLEPHSFINVSILVNHSTLSMWLIVHPHAVVSVSWLVEHSPSTLLLVRLPVSCVLSPQFTLAVCHPKCALPVAFVSLPSAFVFVSVRIVLNAKAVFLIVQPVTYVLVRTDPFVGLLRSIFIQRLFLYYKIIEIP